MKRSTRSPLVFPLFATLIFLASCTPGPADDADKEEQGLHAGAHDVVVPRSRKGATPRIDQSSPENVLATLKDIIATDALDSLKRLCKDGVTEGAPTWLICGMATEDMDQIDKFRGWFSTARIDSAAILKGDTALLPLTLSPGHAENERHAFLVMVQHDGLWYMNTLNWKR